MKERDIINKWKSSKKYKELMAKKKRNIELLKNNANIRINAISSLHEDDLNNFLIDFVNISKEEFLEEDFVMLIIERIVAAPNFHTVIYDTIHAIDICVSLMLHKVQLEEYEKAQFYKELKELFEITIPIALTNYNRFFLNEDEEIEELKNMFEYQIEDIDKYVNIELENLTK